MTDPARLPLHPAETVVTLGPAVVFAPHPDDESLGCGGTIALLRQSDIPVQVVVVSDGTGSHRNSRSYGPDALRRLREAEATEALDLLGVGAENITFLRMPDQAVPRRGAPGFDDAVETVSRVLAGFTVATIFRPWRRDPHCDHRATWDLVDAAVETLPAPVRLIDYPIWLWDLGDGDDAPQPGEVSGWRLDISSVVDLKQAAIAAHRSQTTDLIADDPSAFRLTSETLAHFQRNYEVFLEACP